MKTILRLIIPIFLLLLGACGPAPRATDAPQVVTVEPSGSPTEAPTVAAASVTPSQAGNYQMGSPAFADLWVDPLNGDDGRDGASQASALKTLDAAWGKIPQGEPLPGAYRIRILPGTLPGESLPVYWESRYGSLAAPILIQAENGPGTVTLAGSVSVYDVHYLYFVGLDIVPDPAGDAFHCEKCEHILIRDATLNGGANREAHETVKVNQSQYFYVENSDISGADDNAIDFVAVQYAHVLNSRIHNASDWCAYAKGGSAYIRYEGNEIFACGTGGFTAGQGTGFQFMVPPWLQYEAYDVKVVNNIIHDTDGAGLGVNGGYNILMAYNTLYHVGSRSHLLEAAYGLRSCDGQPGDEGRERCQQYLDAGGWGTTVVDDGTNAASIPNRNVFIYNNVIYNPPGFQSAYQHFAIYGPRSNPASAGIGAVVADENLQIRGNLIWNGGPGTPALHQAQRGASVPLGIEDPEQGCQPSNAACNAGQLQAENAINTVEPHFADAAGADFHPGGDWGASLQTFPVPDFSWGIDNIPPGTTVNLIELDRDGNPRTPGGLPGAYSK